uniref:Uncharacterized protein n=1 Tax=Arundo donax TaxID=35708 RepID=A0A0A8Y4U8_ARUDO
MILLACVLNLSCHVIIDTWRAHRGIAFGSSSPPRGQRAGRALTWPREAPTPPIPSPLALLAASAPVDTVHTALCH